MEQLFAECVEGGNQKEPRPQRRERERSDLKRGAAVLLPAHTYKRSAAATGHVQGMRRTDDGVRVARGTHSSPKAESAMLGAARIPAD